MQTAINGFLNELSSHPKWTSFKSEMRKKFNSELAKFKDSIGQENWIHAEKNYQNILKKLTVAQKQIDQELQKTLKSLKKSAVEVETTLAQYKAIAMKQKAKAKRQASAKKARSAQNSSKAKKAPKAGRATASRRKSSRA